MQKYILFIACMLILLPVSSCDSAKQISTSGTKIEERATTQIEPAQIFLVRHAEKSKDDPKDPSLTEGGKERAERLKFHLANADIKSIYSTDYKRTKQTIQPLADYLGIQPILYNPDLVDITDILKQPQEGNIVVAGHSNTTPKLINNLLGTEKYKSLDESIYDRLFLVTKVGDSFSVTMLKY